MDISSEDYKEYRDLLEGALAIINKYNDVLEQTSNTVLGIPESKLPFPKEAIKLSILMWYKLLLNKSLKEKVIKKYSSKLAKYLLSKDFHDSLEVGYIALSKFIPDEEAKLCDVYRHLTDKLVHEGKEDADITKTLISEMKDMEDLDAILDIQKKIVEDSKKYLRELRKLEKRKAKIYTT